MDTKRLLRAAKVVAQRLGVQRQTAGEFLALQRTRLHVDTGLKATTGKVGLVGCGRQGTTIAGSVRGLPQWQVTHLLDTNEAATTEMRTRFTPDATACASADEFFAAVPSMDVVAIATTAPSHFALTERAIRAGARAVLLEKPVTTRLADCDRLIALAAEHGCRVAVDHTRRYLPSIDAVKRVLSSGTLGAPRSVHVMAGRGGLAMIGSHYFDLIRALFGSDITRIRAELDEAIDPNSRGAAFEDRCGRCEGRLASGLRFTLDLSGDLELRQLAFVIVCAAGRLEVDERLGKVRVVGAAGRVWESEYVFKGALPTGIGVALHELALGRAPRCSLADGRAALEATIACHVSARQEGAWVDLPLAGAVRDEEFPFA